MILSESLTRVPLVIPDKESYLAGWLHSPNSTNIKTKSNIFVICNPIGFEYIHGYRALRHLADELALNGNHVIRFDYFGTGNSPGSVLDNNLSGNLLIDIWVKNIETVTEYAKKITNSNEVVLIGVRLGGTLAALAHQKINNAGLVLWNAIHNGKQYIRELRVVSGASQFYQQDETNILEFGGFAFKRETINTINEINLSKINFQNNSKILLIDRDDLAEFNDMMAEPQFTKIPKKTLRTIVNWSNLNISNQLQNEKLSNQILNQEILFNNRSDKYIQIPSKPGDKNITIFGVASINKKNENNPWIVMFNAGAVHEVGPNRIYVDISRELVKEGFNIFRVNLLGLGDSVVDNLEDENKPYPLNAVSDARDVLKFLREQFNAKKFILLGLCSGAHTAFHSCIEIKDEPITEAILINPLTYDWHEGMTLETTVSNIQEMNYHMDAIFKLASWKKLLTGKFNFSIRKSLRTVFVYIWNQFCNVFKSTKNTRLSENIRLIYEMNRSISLFVASSDPGLKLLLDESKYVSKKLIDSEKIKVFDIKDTDHIFSNLRARNELINKLSNYLKNKKEV